MAEERERHISQRHPDLLPEYREQLVGTLADPDQVRRSVRFGNARLFSRCYTDVKRGKDMVVGETDVAKRCWIITAYLTRRPAEGEMERERS